MYERKREREINGSIRILRVTLGQSDTDCEVGYLFDLNTSANFISCDTASKIAVAPLEYRNIIDANNRAE